MILPYARIVVLLGEGTLRNSKDSYDDSCNREIS